MAGYSVLMSVYHKDKPEYLREAMDSMWRQTVPTDDYVLVCDGPLNAGLDAVIGEMEKLYPEVLRVVRLERNGGLGNALRVGIGYCRNELVARMDADDISRPDRCERQLQVFEKHPDVSVSSGTVEEFSASPRAVEARRALPETQEEIIAFAKRRNPFNHPCVMYRKTAVEDAGNYRDLYLLEDYYLWVRMLMKGYRGYNLQQPLLWMRAGSAMYRRRSGRRYADSQNTLFRYMRDVGFISPGQYRKSMAVRGASSFVPSWLRKRMLKVGMRK